MWERWRNSHKRDCTEGEDGTDKQLSNNRVCRRLSESRAGKENGGRTIEVVPCVERVPRWEVGGVPQADTCENEEEDGERPLHGA